MSDWTCPHGYGPAFQRGDCDACNEVLRTRPDPSGMTGDERAEEVRYLLNDSNAYRVSDIHARLQDLVGRPVWTHEFATDLALAEEARTWEHPRDLRHHLVKSAEALTDAPVVVIDEATS